MNAGNRKRKRKPSTNIADNQNKTEMIEKFTFPPVGLKDHISAINACIKKEYTFLYKYKWEKSNLILHPSLKIITLDEPTISTLNVTSHVNDTIMDFACFGE